MTDLWTYLASDAGAVQVLSIVTALVVQAAKKLFPEGLPEGQQGIVKMIIAAIVAVLSAIFVSLAAGTPLSFGTIITKALMTWGGASVVHGLVLRSAISKTPGKPETA